MLRKRAKGASLAEKHLWIQSMTRQNRRYRKWSLQGGGGGASGAGETIQDLIELRVLSNLVYS